MWWIVVEISPTEDEEIDSLGRPEEVVTVLDSKAMLDVRVYAHRYNNNDRPNIASSLNISMRIFFA